MKVAIAVVLGILGVSAVLADIRPPVRAVKSVTVSGPAAREIWKITEGAPARIYASCAANGAEYTCTLTSL
jgi:hypothetical protein